MTLERLAKYSDCFFHDLSRLDYGSICNELVNWLNVRKLYIFILATMHAKFFVFLLDNKARCGIKDECGSNFLPPFFLSYLFLLSRF